MLLRLNYLFILLMLHFAAITSAQDLYQEELKKRLPTALSNALSRYLTEPKNESQADNLFLLPVTTAAMTASYYLRDEQGVPMSHICDTSHLSFAALALPALYLLKHAKKASQVDQSIMEYVVPASTGSLKEYPKTFRGLRTWAADKVAILRPCVQQTLEEHQQQLNTLQEEKPRLLQELKEVESSEEKLKEDLYEYNEHNTTQEALRLMFEEKKESLQRELEDIESLITQHQQQITAFQEILSTAENYPHGIAQIAYDKETIDRLIKNKTKHYDMLLNGKIKASTIRAIYGDASNMNDFFALSSALQLQVERAEITLQEAVDRNRQ